MRDFLEDADQHRDDGYGRAQHHAKQEQPKRFYKDVGVGTVGDGFAVTLDGRSPRTPGMKTVIVPSEALAKAMAVEWAAQGEFIDPATMPLVRLVNSGVEAGDNRVQAFRDEVVKYAGNDLLLYRADAPRELVAEQERQWDAALTKLARHFGVGTVGDGFAVTLDGRSPRTPGMKPVVVPSEALAQAMAVEWTAQGGFIDPATMPLVRLVNSGIEAGDDRVQAFRDEVVKYAGNDLLLYRADAPRELVAEQERQWDAVLTKVARHFGVSFQPTMGIVHQAQPAPTLARLGDVLAGEALIPLVAMVSLTGITGSGLLAIALRHGVLTPDEAWTAAHVDEDHNIRLWGEVAEASERREKRRKDYDTAVRVLEMMPR